MQEREFWKADSRAIDRRLQRFVVPPEAQDDWESERLWRKVSAAIVANDVHAAAEEKGVLEDAQRAAARSRKETDADVETKLFERDELLEEWVYKYADSRPWDPHNDLSVYENDFIVGTRTKHRTPVIRTTSLTCVVQKKREKRRKKTASSTLTASNKGGLLGSQHNNSAGGGLNEQNGGGSAGGGERPGGASPSPPTVAMLQKRESGSSTGSVYRPEDSESSEDSKPSAGGGGGGGGGATAANEKSDNKKGNKSSHSSSSKPPSPQKLHKRARFLGSSSPTRSSTTMADSASGSGRGGGGGGGDGGGGVGGGAGAAFSAEDVKKAMEPLAFQILQLRRTVEAGEADRRHGSLTKKDMIMIAIVLTMQFVISWIMLR